MTRSNEITIAVILLTALLLPGCADEDKVAEPVARRWSGSIPDPGDGAPQSRVSRLVTYQSDLFALVTSGSQTPMEERLALWDGSEWRTAAVTPPGQEIWDLAEWGGRLVVAGSFESLSGQELEYLAAWDGSSWSALGAPVSGPVRGLTLWNDNLVAVGYFDGFGDEPGWYCARWDGIGWTMMAEAEEIFSIAPFGDGLVAPITKNGEAWVMRWRGADWSRVGTFTGSLGTGNVAWNPQANAFAVFQNDLVVAGGFTNVDGVAANGVARWRDETWHPLSGGINGTQRGVPVFVQGLAVFEGSLIAVGTFDMADSSLARGVAGWDGVRWSPFGDGILGDYVGSVVVYDGRLVVGGEFSLDRDPPIRNIAVWE